MPKIDIELRDQGFNEIKDYLAGRPTVYVTLAINGQVVLAGEPALVDTGSNRTMILPAAAFQQKAKGVAQFQTATDEDLGLSFDAVIEIDGLGDSIPVEVSTRTNLPYMVLLGRDVLGHYRMICDPISGEFSLEKP